MECSHVKSSCCNVSHMSLCIPVVQGRLDLYALKTSLVRAERWSISIPMSWSLKWSIIHIYHAAKLTDLIFCNIHL